MKKLFVYIAIVCSLLFVAPVKAQNPIATLKHNGATQVFYGQGSFIEAYNASSNGDHIYLSTGFFTPPPSIAKGIKIIGAGHFPDSVNVTKRTFILNSIIITKGADSLNIEGLYINGNIDWDGPNWEGYGTNSINYVIIKRCRLVHASFHSHSIQASKNNCNFEECFFEGGINFSKYGNNFLVKHCIIGGVTGVSTTGFASIGNIDGNAIIDGNIFLSPSTWIYGVNNSLIQNNITYNNFQNGIGNEINNNLFLGNFGNSIYFPNNNSFNNYIEVSQTDIFLNQTGNGIDYAHDYHLKDPGKYLGTDGTQVGIYGGTTPFKEKGLPSNPQIIKKNVANQTDSNGNLPINFTVKAQKN